MAAFVASGPLAVSAFTASTTTTAPCALSHRIAPVRSGAAAITASADQPLLVRAAKGQVVDRPPVWMMRQAGRYMKVYQELAKRHPSFRERSENTDLSTEISLQPWTAFKPDGVILFSDILTPLPGMGINFEIPDKGPVIENPIRSMTEVAKIGTLDPTEATPFVGETLQNLRREVGDQGAVLGFVGAPYTLATYCVEGGTSKSYSAIKKMAFTEPEILHALLAKFADNIALYVMYQIENGAQAVQMFDSWAGQLSQQDFDILAAPYQKRVVDQVKEKYPDIPFILYISNSAAVLERMAATGVDIVSVDWTVDMAEARARVGDCNVQGNMDPAVLLGSKEFITERVHETIHKAGKTGHIMNLGHGVLPETPEDNVAHYFKTVQDWKW